jgi:hypothetical protein
LIHSDDDAPDGLLIVSPIGVYLERVKRGIDHVISSYASIPKSGVKPTTKLRVILVAQPEWLNGDPEYEDKFVANITTHVLGGWTAEGYDIECTCDYVSYDDEEHLVGWLLSRLGSFFKKNGKQMACIDLTAGPKEWQFAAINVAQYFPNLVFYNVKPKAVRKPSDYDPTEINDPGRPIIPVINLGEAAYAAWVTPKNDAGMHHQYVLFRTIFDIAREHASDPSSPTDLASVWVAINDADALGRYREAIQGQKDDPSLRKSISKHLTAVQPLRLFEVNTTKKHVRMTVRAAMLALSLFSQQPD